MNARARFITGIILLVIGSILPVGGLMLAGTSLPIEIKAPLCGFLFFGFEIMLIPAVAVLGKENYEAIVAKVYGWLKRLKPAGNIGKTRHAIGLVLFLLPIVPSYIMGYMPSWLPDSSPMRLYVSIASDMMLLVSLFVLGGDFWDKIRALFVREARAWFPEEARPVVD